MFLNVRAFLTAQQRAPISLTNISDQKQCKFTLGKESDKTTDYDGAGR